jgi:hypothetical protein
MQNAEGQTMSAAQGRRFTIAAVAAVMVILAAIPVAGQSGFAKPRVAGQLIASQFGKWQTGATVTATAGGTGSIVVDIPTVTLPDSFTLMPFATNAPLSIQDAQPEVVTPTSVSCAENAPTRCVITATFAYSHNGRVRISSGTFGLQEAINFAQGTGGGQVVITPDWAGTTAQITAATGYGDVTIHDERTGDAWYSWTGSAYSPAFQVSSGAVTATTAGVGTLTANLLIARNLDQWRYADQYTGSDMGAQIVAAAADCSNNCSVAVPTGAYPVSTTVTLPAADIHFAQGAMLKPASGVTVTFTRGPVAGRYQICDESAGGTCTFSGPTDLIYPEWFGAVADGATDSGPAFQEAMNAAAGVCGTISIAANTLHYEIKTQVQKPPCVNVRGIGNIYGKTYGPFVDINGAGLTGFYDTSYSGGNPTYAYEGDWENIAFRCLGNAATVIAVEGRERANIQHNTFGLVGSGTNQSCYGPAIYYLQDNDSWVRDNFVLDSGCTNGVDTNCARTSAQVELDTVYEGGTEDNIIEGASLHPLAGMRLNRDQGLKISGDHYLSTGIPLLIQDISQGTLTTNSLDIGPLNLENPTCTTATCDYIDIGSGWTGGGYGAQEIRIHDVAASVSGSTTIKYGITLYNTYAVTVDGSFAMSASTGNIALFNLAGTGNADYKFKGPINSNFASPLYINGVDQTTNNGNLSALNGFDYTQPIFQSGAYIGQSLLRQGGYGSGFECFTGVGTGTSGTPEPCYFNWEQFDDGTNRQGYTFYCASGNCNLKPDAAGTGTKPTLNIGDQANASGTELWGNIVYNRAPVFDIYSTNLLQLGSTTVGSLPAAASYPGGMIRVSDSTSVATEGQTCVGSSSNNAIAISNGSVWKCF